MSEPRCGFITAFLQGSTPSLVLALCFMVPRLSDSPEGSRLVHRRNSHFLVNPKGYRLLVATSELVAGAALVLI